MKKFFVIAAAAALTLASCAKVETISKVNDDQHIIDFSNYAPRALAKASSANYVDGTTLVPNAQFKVWGWYTANGVSFNGTGTDYFGNPGEWYTVIYKDGGKTDGNANDYSVDGPRYWPTGDTPDYLHFYAYYPSNAGTITAPDGFGAFSFTAEATAAAQVDFMIAPVVKDQTYDKANGNPGTNSNVDGTVALNFKHQLTKVQVKFRTIQAIVDDTNTNITVNSAEFGHINNTGKLTTSYQKVDDHGLIDGETGYNSATAVDSTATRWSAVTGDASYDIAVPAGNLTTTAANSGDDANDIFLLVPQVMVGPTRDANGDVTADATAQYIDIEWTVTTKGVPTVNSKRIYLDECVTTDPGSTQANIDWKKNNFVTYIITIAPNQILFTGAATGWDDESFGYYRVF